MPGERLARWLKVSIGLAISIAFTVLFLLNTNLEQVADSLAGADYIYVVPALALFALSLAVRALRWRYLYRPARALDWRKLLPSLLVGYAGNNLLPLRAGELLRAQHIAARAAVPRMVSFGTFVMERVFDFMVLSTFVLWGVLLAGVGGAYLGVALLLAGGTAAGTVICLVLALNPTLLSRLMSRPLPLLPERIRLELGSLSESFFAGFSCLTHPAIFGLVALVTAAAWSLELGMYWLLSVAFDLHADLLTVAFAGAAANVAMSVPSAQGGVGPFQYYAKEALLKFQVAGPAATAYAVALHIFLIVPVSLAGLAVLWRSTLSVRGQAVPAVPAQAEPAE